MIVIRILSGLVIFCSASCLLLTGCADSRPEEAQAAANRWADKLDGMTNPNGTYQRWKQAALPETDPWGQAFIVTYTMGGMAEQLTVRSLGPDGESNTEDDIVAARSSLNLKGVGTGVKENMEEVAEKAGRGAAKGMVRGLKDGINEIRSATATTTP